MRDSAKGLGARCEGTPSVAHPWVHPSGSTRLHPSAVPANSVEEIRSGADRETPHTGIYVRVRTDHRRVRAACVAASLACIAVFIALRVQLVRQGGESGLDRWVAARVERDEGSPAAALVERGLTKPGSRKGATLISLAIGAWAWVRRRDLRWGLLLLAVFTGTTATVAIVKIGIVLQPFDADLDRAYLSEHAANAAAVFGMILVLSILSHERLVLIGAVGAIAAGAVAVVALVSFSVVAAGHHYLSDVIGGFAVAGAWVFALTPAAHSMWRRPQLIAALSRSNGDTPFASVALPRSAVTVSMYEPERVEESSVD
jgi:membrane-associated phospholipid phosphatase